MRLTKYETWQAATAPVSDLETITDELRKVYKRTRNADQKVAICNAITCIEKAVRYLTEMDG